MSGAKAVGGRAAAAAGDVLACVAGCDEGGECVGGGLAMKMSFHTLVGGEVAGDLEELHAEEHGYPCELEGGPDGENDGEGVFVENLTELFGEYGTGDCLGCIEVLEIWL